MDHRALPAAPYSAIAIGSANGALTHLWAALGIPWLPQTFLIPVARSGPHPDEPGEDLEWAKPWAAQLVWHVFQFGALGGAAPEEYHCGSERVADYLGRQGSHRRGWEPPRANLEHPKRQARWWPTCIADAFSHGVESIGLVPIEHWRALLSRARRRGFLLMRWSLPGAGKPRSIRSRSSARHWAVGQSPASIAPCDSDSVAPQAPFRVSRWFRASVPLHILQRAAHISTANTR